MNTGDYTYIKGSRTGAEAVEFVIFNEDRTYHTTAVVNAYLLTIGVVVHPCGNGEDVHLTMKQAADILKVIQEARNAIKYSGKPKSLQGWHDSGLGDLDEYLAYGDEVDEELAHEQMNVVPPHYRSMGIIQVGEPYTDVKSKNGRYRPVFGTFLLKGKGDRTYWEWIGYCFSKETTNMIPERDRAGEALKPYNLFFRGGDTA